MVQPQADSQFFGDLMDAKVQGGFEQASTPSAFRRKLWLAAAALGLTGASAAIVTNGREAIDWVQRDVLAIPSAIRDSYRQPGTTVDVVLDSRNYYPYDQSTLELYAAQERLIFPDRDGAETALTIANNIANRVALAAHERVQKRAELRGDSKLYTMEEAFAELASSQAGLQEYVCLIGEELLRAGCYYKIEQSLDAAVDETKHLDGKFHLDCDLLCHVALHAASRHDMPLHAIRAPQHMFLGSPVYENFAVEMTLFRGEPLRQANGETTVTFGSGFLTDLHTMKSYLGRRLSQAEIERAGYFEAMSQTSIAESAVGNLLVDVFAEALREKDIARLTYVTAVADRELARYEGHDILAQNVYAVHRVVRDYNVKLWKDSGKADTEALFRSLFHAERIERLIHSHGEMITSSSFSQDKSILRELRGAELALNGSGSSNHLAQGSSFFEFFKNPDEP
ncbi:MAG: hypothetical protein KDD64_04910 [Bdellovibrionales bacterium]|nr:hypothetical protein [Bdellovibrionales bacterium]